MRNGSAICMSPRATNGSHKRCEETEPHLIFVVRPPFTLFS